MAAYLVSGANKGIGFEIVKTALAHASAPTVFLGSRSVERGNAARAKLPEAQQERCVVVQLDVTSPESIAAAVGSVKKALGEGGKLQGLVNNAGGVAKGDGFGWTDVEDLDRVVALNFGGVLHLTKAFVPLLEPKGGRIVNLSSGAAPMFVEKLSAANQAVLTDPTITVEKIGEFLKKFRKVGEEASAKAAEAEDDAAAASEAVFKAAGLTPSIYGLTKAALNSLTMFLAKQYPALKINSCSPGFIATDLVAAVAESRGMSATDMGALSPAKGAVCPSYLLFGDVPTPPGRGYYYGSDMKRSPLDKYRSAGAPQYVNEEY